MHIPLIYHLFLRGNFIDRGGYYLQVGVTGVKLPGCLNDGYSNWFEGAHTRMVSFGSGPTTKDTRTDAKTHLRHFAPRTAPQKG